MPLPSVCIATGALLLLSLAASVRADVLIHGYTVIIQPPNGTDPRPRDATFTTSNFFSYASPEGYLSFGWFMPAGPSTDTSHCVADTDDYEWYEYSSGDCQLERCRVYVKNFDAAHPQSPSFEADYDARTVKIGDEPAATLAVSYFDETNGAYAVGSRTLLGLDGVELGTSKQCNEAFETVRRIEKRFKVPVKFPLQNPCSAVDGAALVVQDL